MQLETHSDAGRVLGESGPPAGGNGAEMALVPGRTFAMGSDSHYPEEAPAHPVTFPTPGPEAGR